jgi:hypothetical protein
MKKIYAYMMTILALASCQVTNPSSKVVEANDLMNYNHGEMGRCVTCPAELLDVLIGFEEYMHKSDEDKMYDQKYYGRITDYGSDTYGISAQVSGLNCTVNTGGKSIWEEGAEWEFSIISYYGHYKDPMFYINHEVYFDKGGVLKMENPSDSVWTFHADGMESRIRMIKSDSTMVWNVEGHIKETGENGLSSVSTTGANGMSVKKVWIDLGTTYPRQEISYSGSFSTDFYKNDEKIDFCTITFRPGFTLSCTASR